MTSDDVHITAPSDNDNVISVSFAADENAYPALTKLKELDDQGQIGLKEAAVVVRSDGGDIEVKDRIGPAHIEGAAGGGLLGLLIGIVGGPLGVLIGGAYGLLVGSLFDVADVKDTESVLTEISASVKPGHPALLAQISEQAPEVVDLAMGQLGGTVLRRSTYDVEAEIAAAEEAQRKAKWEARKELMHGRQERNKERVHAKVQELKDKLPRREKAASST
jgi:uncharacterized membrane protein